MPIKQYEKDGKYYFQWGNHGKQYFFNPNSKRSQTIALNKCKQQMKAIFSNGYKGTGVRIIHIPETLSIPCL